MRYALSVLLLPALLRPALAQDNDAEKLFGAMDAKTMLPLRRVLVSDGNDGPGRISETCSFNLSPKIDAGAFALPNGAKTPPPDAKKGSAKGDSAQRVPLDELPRTVTDAIKKRFPKTKLREAGKRTEKSNTVYDVDTTNAGLYVGLTVTAEGRITAIVKQIKSEHLPKGVTQFLAKKYPKETVDTIDELIRLKEGKESLEYFRVLLLTPDREKRVVFFSPEGTFVKEES